MDMEESGSSTFSKDQSSTCELSQSGDGDETEVKEKVRSVSIGLWNAEITESKELCILQLILNF